MCSNLMTSCCNPQAKPSGEVIPVHNNQGSCRLWECNRLSVMTCFAFVFGLGSAYMVYCFTCNGRQKTPPHQRPSLTSLTFQCHPDVRAIPNDAPIIASHGMAGLADPMISVNYIKENLRELGVSQVDLALVHRPCQPHQTKDPVAANNALWKGMQMALKMGLTRSIGVSNYVQKDLEALDQTVQPAVNQCDMSIKTHDDATIAYCQSKGIVYV